MLQFTGQEYSSIYLYLSHLIFTEDIYIQEDIIFE